MPSRPSTPNRLHMLGLAAVLVALVACEGGPEPPIGRPEDGPARFEFVSSWEPSIEERGYSTFIDYSFTVRNVGGRAGAPECEIALRNEVLDGWSQGPEVGVDSEARVRGRVLLPYGADANKVLPRLQPRCNEATNQESLANVEKRLFGVEGDEAYFQLQQQGWKVRFGSRVSPSERMNIRGNRSHPEVVITELRSDENFKVITIEDVDCVGREADIC